ncbi:MAG TPA: hypothetical protein VGP93_00165, partial [Polyangiaceae bacterium]|nr:hypothetical protein [Polyangiaceae bacterium]
MRVKSLFWPLLALLALGCHPSSGGPQSRASVAPFGKVAGGPDVSRWMKLPAQGDAQVLAVEAGVAGDRIAALLEVPETDCAVLIARGTSTVDDVDMFAYGEDGAVLGSDEGSDKAPALLICPPHPRRIYVSARIAAGHGLVAIGAERVAVKDAEKAAALYGVRHRPGEIARRLSVWPGLDEQLEQHRRGMGAKWVDVRRVAVPLDSRMPTRVSAGVDADRCLDVFVLPSDDVGYLDVTALDERGAIVGRAPSAGRSRTLIVCSPAQAGLTVEIRPHAGIGLAVVMLSRTSEESERDIDPRAPRFDLFPTGTIEDAKSRMPLKQKPARRVASGSLEVGRRSSSELDLASGCSRIDVVGGAPLRGIEAWLWSASDGSLLASERGGGKAILFACSHAGKARLDIEALARGGPYVVEVAPEPDAPPLLSENPLAASRLIARMVNRGVVTAAADVGAVQKLSLEPTKLGEIS